MARVEINQQALKGLYEQLGQRIQSTAERVMRETEGLSLDDAAQRMHHAMAAIEVRLPLETCRGAVETMRAGERFTFHLG